jgi:beta-lactam-binding protein with PASTA domain
VELLRSGLQIGEISSVYLGDLAGDAVIQQDPRPGGGMASPRVNFLVSGGAREPAYVMPYLVGLSQSEAQRQLAPASLKELKITPVQASQWPRGTVIDQVPASGARLVSSAGAELRVAE